MGSSWSRTSARTRPGKRPRNTWSITWRLASHSTGFTWCRKGTNKKSLAGGDPIGRLYNLDESVQDEKCEICHRPTRQAGQLFARDEQDQLGRSIVIMVCAACVRKPYREGLNEIDRGN